MAEPRYQEDPNFKPNPSDQYGVVNTTGTAGASAERVENVTPIFDHAKAHDLSVAKKALDPSDPTPENLVTLPSGQNMVAVDPQAAADRVTAKADALEDDPFVPGAPNPAEVEAAQGEGSEGSQGESWQRAADEPF